MTTVRFAEGRLWVADTPVPLLSGEVHYWRLDPANWRPVIERAKSLGLGLLASYVCWDFHELAPGQLDFEGATDARRNLLGFLDLLAEAGLWVILRPGPYIYSEWRNNGVPDDAARFHRLHPGFQQRAEPYMRAVVAAVRPHLATHGGRIVLWQADNEIDPWPHLYTEQLGLGQAAGPFQAFLRERYASVEALNEAWGTAYTGLEQARAVMTASPDEPERMRRYLDTARFGHWYVNAVARWTADTYRSLGVDVPILFNTYSGTATQRWADLEAIGDLAGPDIYPSQEFALRPNEHRNFLEAVRYTRAYSRAPYIPEFEAGIWHGWHVDVGTLGPNHYRLMCLSAWLGGATGWNWYMLANRDNWYMSPINEWGRTRPDLYEVFERLAALHAELDPPSLTKLTVTGVTHDALQRGTVRPGQELLEAFYQAGIDYEFFDVTLGRRAQPLMFYAGGHWLAASAQQRLRDYVEAGGHLVCLGQSPRQDDGLRPCNLLEVVEPAGVVSGRPDTLRLAVTMAGGAAVTADSAWAFIYDSVPGRPVVAERLPHAPLTAEELVLQTDLQAGTRYVVGYQQALGAGTMTVIGLQPSPSLLLTVHRDANARLYARARSAQTSAAVYRRGETLYVVVVNTGEASAAAVELDRAAFPLRRYRVDDLLAGSHWTLDLDLTTELTINLPPKDGTVLRLMPAG